MAVTLLSRAKSDYLFLKRLNPKHELLKYFIMDERGFNISQDDDVIDEFIRKFRGNVIPQELAIKMKMPAVIYKCAVLSSSFGNYISSLEKAIKNIISMN